MLTIVSNLVLLPKKYFTIFSFFLFFQIGGIQLILNKEWIRNNHFENFFLPGNELIIEVKEVGKLKMDSDYRKVIGEVQAVIGLADTVQSNGKVLVYFQDIGNSIQLNDLLLFKPILSNVSNRNNPGEFDAERYWRFQSIRQNSFVLEDDFVIIGRASIDADDVFTSIRNFFSNILDRFINGQEGAVAKGLILGDRSSIENETTRMFGNTGAMHILAVSGMHVSILVQLLGYFLLLFPKYITKKKAVWISLIIVWVYCLMTGFSASVARAAWMFTFVSGSVLLGKTNHPINGLVVSALIIVIFQPFALFDIGFQLSYCAMIGIYSIYPYLKKQLYFKQKRIQEVWDATALGIAAQLVTTPLALYYFHQFPNYFFITNIALGVYSLIVLLGGIVLFTFSWSILLGKGIAFLLFWVMFSMLWIIQFIDGLPQAISEGFVLSFWLVIFLYVLISLLYWSLTKQHMKLLWSCLTIGIFTVSVMVFDRYQRMNSTDLVVFNNNHLVMAWKNEDQLLVLVDEKLKKRNQLDQLVNGFQKLYPSQRIDTIFLSNQKRVDIQMGKNELSMLPTSTGYELSLNHKNYFIASSSRFQSTQAKLITMPFINENMAYYQLKNGAFYFKDLIK